MLLSSCKNEKIHTMFYGVAQNCSFGDIFKTQNPKDMSDNVNTNITNSFIDRLILIAQKHLQYILNKIGYI